MLQEIEAVTGPETLILLQEAYALYPFPTRW